MSVCFTRSKEQTENSWPGNRTDEQKLGFILKDETYAYLRSQGECGRQAHLEVNPLVHRLLQQALYQGN